MLTWSKVRNSKLNKYRIKLRHNQSSDDVKLLKGNFPDDLKLGGIDIEIGDSITNPSKVIIFNHK